MRTDHLAELKLDANDSSPLYMQLARKLERAVRDGRYQPDEALPSERLLSEVLEVSRVTARKAIDQLVDQGLIVRRRGSGNYIAPHIETPLSRLTSFSEQLRQRGYLPSSRWLTRELRLARGDEQMKLGLSPNAQVARLERLRLADHVVIAYEVSILPQAVVPEPQRIDGSLYEHLQQMQKVPVRALQHIRAINAPDDIARKLGIPVGQAVLFITRVSYLDNGRAVEITDSYCRSEYYDFVAELRREG